MTSPLFLPLTLPNGSVLPNRIAKAAMSENMAGPGQVPDQRLIRLYEAFAFGGAGLLITGHVMIGSHSVSEPANVVLERDTELATFRTWAKAARSQGAQVWMQINHPGRQVMASLGQPGMAPSEVAMDMGRLSTLFAKPRAMHEFEIQQTIRQFATTARKAEEAGFTGVEIHAAHGYLISQFLSPRTNLRQDQWGGSLENRARLLLEIVKAVRAAVAKDFCVAVKLNSADFQRGGFDAADALEVVKMLNGYAVDLVELSGGSYESPSFSGETKDGTTLAREAYFLEFAQAIAKIAAMPIMTTGGIRRLEVAEEVLSQGVAMVGMATALAMNPALPLAWLQGKREDGIQPKVTFLKGKKLVNLARLAIVTRQLRRIGAGQRPKVNLSTMFTMLCEPIRNMALTRRYRSWLAG